MISVALRLDPGLGLALTMRS